MNKNQKIEVLKAAGIEVEETLTVAAIDALAAEKGVSFEAPKVETPKVETPKETATEDRRHGAREALIAVKVAAGLSRDAAIEVIERQEAHDKALAKKSQ